MRIWKLTPTDPYNPIWEKWSPEPIIVRARCAAEARHLAVLKTVKFLPAIPGAPISLSTWGGHKKLEDPGPLPSVCEDITEQTDEFSANGPAGVLRYGEKF
jgi:hypothetical protein